MLVVLVFFLFLFFAVLSVFCCGLSAVVFGLVFLVCLLAVFLAAGLRFFPVFVFSFSRFSLAVSAFWVPFSVK